MELNSQFTKEQLIGHAQRRCEVIEEIIADPSTDPVSRDHYGREVVMGKIALASLTAEPIGAFHIADQQVEGTTDYIRDGEWPIDNGVIEVYAAQPVSVVPATLPCSVELKPGLIIGKGCKTETLLTALQRRADYYAEIDAMTQEERAEHEANIEAFKAMLPQPAQPDIEMLPSALRNAPLAPSDSQGRPRVPIVPDEIPIGLTSRIINLLSSGLRDHALTQEIWNICRAAMLKGGAK